MRAPGFSLRRAGVLAVASTCVACAALSADANALDLPVQVPNPLAPANVQPPRAAGSTVQGATLTADPGTWSTPVRYAYRWQRCKTTCVLVPGATAKTFKLSAADVGSRLRVLVTATNDFGSTTATSGQTATVRSAFVVRPAPTPKPKPQPEKKPAKKPKLKRLPARITIEGRLTGDGARITSFVVRTVRGATIRYRCTARGDGCPRARSRSAKTRSRRVRVRALERSFPAGVTLRLRVTKRGTIGRYMRLRIRSDRVPARLDRCLKPGARKPTRCR